MTTKQIITGVMLVALFASCRKNVTPIDPVDPVDPTPAPKMLLSKRLTDGDLLQEFIYDTDRKLVRYNVFMTAGPEPSYYGLYEYHSGNQVNQLKTYYNDQLSGKTAVNYNPNKTISELILYNNSGAIYRKNKFEYNANNQMIRLNEFNSQNTLTGYIDHEYNNMGILVKQKRFVYVNGQPVLNYENIVEPEGDISKYGHWDKYRLNPTELFRFEMTTKSVRYVSYSNGVVDSDMTDHSSAKEYNSNGYLTKQTITRKYVKPSLPDATYTYEYQYIL